MTAPLGLSRQWQFPLLVGSGALLMIGVIRLIPPAIAPTFDDELAAPRQTMTAGDFAAAHAQVTALFKSDARSPDQQATLHRLAAEIIHRAEAAVAPHSPANAQRIVAHLKDAEELGSRLPGEDLVRLGDALDWTGDRTGAIDAWRQALASRAPDAPAIRRRLIERIDADPNPDAAEQAAGIQHELDALIADPRIESGDLFWALQRKIDVHLSHGRTPDALAALGEIEKRLAGTPFGQEVVYQRARILFEDGQLDEAGRALAEFLSAGGPRDDLWARATALSARIANKQSNAELALSMCEDVMDSYHSGPVYAACLHARAEALFALGEYELSADSWRELIDLTDGAAIPGIFDPELARTTLTALAETLNQKGQPLHGLAFLRLARKLVAESDAGQRAVYESLLAELCGSLAEAADRQAKAAPDEATKAQADRQRAQLYRERGEALARLAELRTADEPAATDATLRAVEAFELAGDRDRVVAMLEAFIAAYPASSKRVSSMHRLALAFVRSGAHPRAVATFERILFEYPRTQEAIHSLIPLVGSLLALGGEHTRRAEDLLLEMLDRAPDREPLFDPRAAEYADALFHLSELYYEQRHNEQAIERLEAFASLYPDDPRMIDIQFMLADAYRRSGTELRDHVADSSDPRVREKTVAEVEARLNRAHDLFAQVIAAASAASADVSPLRHTRLRAAWLYRGDCLFDLSRLEDARDVYAEAAWRFDNELTSVTASMQLVRCYQRLGDSQSGRAVLSRLKWLIGRMPDAAFEGRPGAADKSYWQATVDRMLQNGIY